MFQSGVNDYSVSEMPKATEKINFIFLNFKLKKKNIVCSYWILFALIWKKHKNSFFIIIMCIIFDVNAETFSM